MKIVADNKIPFLKGAFEGLAEIVYLPGNAISSNDLLDADALIIRTRTKCSAALLDNTKVKFIATATIGYDHIDTDYCKINGIEWTNAPGCNSSSVEQYIVSALLKLGIDNKFSLDQKTLGIVGVGNVGTKVARAAEALGMSILLNDPPRARKEGGSNFVDIEKIKEEADIISFHVPLNKEGVDKTIHIANEGFLKGMKSGSILINTSRGEVVDNKPVKKVLKEGYLQAVVLDVWENEPVIDTDLLSMVTVGTSHIAGYSTDGKANGTTMSVQAVSRFFNLGIDNWEPDSIPNPKNSVLEIDCKGLSRQEVLFELYTRCYDISEDDGLLKSNPQEFEKLRGSYRIRRESSSYLIKLKNNSYDDMNEILKNLGFLL